MGKKTDKQFDDKINKLADQSLEIKTKAKKGKTMNAKRIVITTIVTTLLVLAAFVGTFYAGTRYEADRTAKVTTEAAKLVETLKSKR